MGLSPLTRIVTNLERHLLSLSNRDFAAHTHATRADLLQDLVVGQFTPGRYGHERSNLRTSADAEQLATRPPNHPGEMLLAPGLFRFPGHRHENARAATRMVEEDNLFERTRAQFPVLAELE